MGLVKLASHVLIPDIEGVTNSMLPGINFSQKKIWYEVPDDVFSQSKEKREKYIKSVKSHKGIASGYVVGSLIPAVGVATGLKPKVGLPLAAGIVGASYGAGKLHEYLRTKQRQKHIRNIIEANLGTKKKFVE